MKKIQVIISIFIVIFFTGIIGSACSDQKTQKSADKKPPAASEKEDDGQEIKEAPPAKDTDESPQKTNETDQEIKSDSGQTVVTSPKENDTIKSPVEITGRAVAFENTVNIRIKDDADKILAETFATADSPDVGEFGNFSVSVEFKETNQKNGVVEVFQISAKDGSETDKVTIPVTFASD